MNSIRRWRAAEGPTRRVGAPGRSRWGGWVAALAGVVALLSAMAAASAQDGPLVDINQATVEELQALPGIGAVKARAIVEYRETHGPFTQVDQLTEVSGIGPSTLESLRPLVTIGAEGDGGGEAREVQGPPPIGFDEDPVIDLTEDVGSSVGPPTLTADILPPSVSGEMVGQRPAGEETSGGEDVQEAEADRGGPAVAETTPSVAQGALVNVNTADLATLRTLPGIGQVKAQAIIDYREANGPFGSIDELDDVPGIGPATLERIRPLVTLGEDATPGGSDT